MICNYEKGKHKERRESITTVAKRDETFERFVTQELHDGMYVISFHSIYFFVIIMSQIRLHLLAVSETPVCYSVQIMFLPWSRLTLGSLSVSYHITRK